MLKPCKCEGTPQGATNALALQPNHPHPQYCGTWTQALAPCGQIVLGRRVVRLGSAGAHVGPQLTEPCRFSQRIRQSCKIRAVNSPTLRIPNMDNAPNESFYTTDLSQQLGRVPTAFGSIGSEGRVVVRSKVAVVLLHRHTQHPSADCSQLHQSHSQYTH